MKFVKDEDFPLLLAYGIVTIAAIAVILWRIYEAV